MAITTVNVTGPVVTPNSDDLTSGTVKFVLTGWDTDVGNNETIYPETVTATIDASGDFTAALWPNDRGSQATRYRVYLTGETTKGGFETLVALISVPEDGAPHGLEDLLAAGAPTVNAVLMGLITQGQYDAAMAAVADAEAARDLAQEWAENPEDTAVTGHPGEYSALHHAAKAAASAAVADVKATAAANSVGSVVDRAYFATVAVLVADNNTIVGYSGAGASFEVSAGDYLSAGAYSYQVAASGAVDHHITTAGGVKLYVQPASDGAYHSMAFGIVPSSDNAAELNAFLVAAKGRKAVIDYSPVPYKANTLLIKDDTLLIVEPGVQIIGRGDGSARVLQTNGDRIVLWAYGAYFELPDADISHTVYISGPEDFRWFGGRYKGPGLPNIHESDVVYVGGDPSTWNISRNIYMRDVEAFNARRNIVSLTAVHGFTAEYCDFHGTLVGGTLKKVIDVEANRYMPDGSSAISRIRFNSCKFHDSASSLFHIGFGDDVLVENSEFYDCADSAVSSSSGGAQFNPAIGAKPKVWRPGDLLGLVSIDDATGWVTVSTSTKLTDDLGVEVGMRAQLIRQNSVTADWPTELAGYKVVQEISPDQLSMRFSETLDYNIVTSTTGTGTGTISEDPDASELVIRMLRRGMSSNLVFRGNRITGDFTGEAVFAHYSSLDVVIENNVLDVHNALTAINSAYGQKIRVFGNTINGNGTSNIGISLGQEDSASGGNDVFGFDSEGIISNVSYSVIGDGRRDRVHDCGRSGTKSQIRVTKGVNSRVTAIVRNGPIQSSNGIRLDSAYVSNSLVVNSTARNAGTSNSNSISGVGSNGNVVRDSIKYDGTFA